MVGDYLLFCALTSQCAVEYNHWFLSQWIYLLCFDNKRLKQVNIRGQFGDTGKTFAHDLKNKQLYGVLWHFDRNVKTVDASKKQINFKTQSMLHVIRKSTNSRQLFGLLHFLEYATVSHSTLGELFEKQNLKKRYFIWPPGVTLNILVNYTPELHHKWHKLADID